MAWQLPERGEGVCQVSDSSVCLLWVQHSLKLRYAPSFQGAYFNCTASLNKWMQADRLLPQLSSS